MRLKVVRPDGTRVVYENCYVTRNVEFPNWLDVVRETHKPRLPRADEKIVAMLPAGTYVYFERNAEEIARYAEPGLGGEVPSRPRGLEDQWPEVPL